MLPYTPQEQHETKSRQMRLWTRGWEILGFIVSQRGFEANLKNIKAVMDMQHPQTIKDIQKLAGRLATLR